MTDSGQSRAFVRQLLMRLIQGDSQPRDVFAEARSKWLSRRWPTAHEEGYDLIAQEVLFVLADAREMGVTHADAPALLEYLESEVEHIEASRSSLYDYVMTVDAEARTALQQSDDYYGPRSPTEDDERWEIAFSDPEQRRLHRGVRMDPELVWEDVLGKLCEEPPRDELFLSGLLEDLMYSHADQFIDRIESLSEECVHAHDIIGQAYVDGIAPTPAVERFWQLQERLRSV